MFMSLSQALLQFGIDSETKNKVDSTTFDSYTSLLGVKTGDIKFLDNQVVVDKGTYILKITPSTLRGEEVFDKKTRSKTRKTYLNLRFRIQSFQTVTPEEFFKGQIPEGVTTVTKSLEKAVTNNWLQIKSVKEGELTETLHETANLSFLFEDEFKAAEVVKILLDFCDKSKNLTPILNGTSFDFNQKIKSFLITEGEAVDQLKRFLKI